MYSTDGFETGVIYCDDNLERLRDMPPESVDLIYLDPPFFSNRDYEVIWGDEAEVRSFEDRWAGGMNHYVDWMKRRVAYMHRVLKPTGSIYLHCDPTASHYLKVMMDGIFGMGNFRNEIVWKRTSARSDSHKWNHIHDTIFFYTKSDRYTWNPQYTAYDPSYVEKFYRHVEPGTRRRYASDNLTAAGTREGSSGDPWRGIDVRAKGIHWKYTIERLEELDREGRILWPKKEGGVPRYKRYLDEMPGLAVQSIITDISPLSAQSAEKYGYPTQKPLILLERIVRVSSNPSDVVLDPFCGCGTTIAAAQTLGRRWIGIDISLTAAEIMKARVEKVGAKNVKIKGEPKSVDDLRKLKPFEFQNWVIRRVVGSHSPRKTGDMGIDGFSHFERLPIQIKRSERVGRPVVDNFETAVERYGADKGYIVALSFTSGAHEEVARVKNVKNLEIELVEAKAILTGTSHLVPPRVDRRVYEMPQGPPKEARPTAEELVASDQHSEEVA